jgi:uncharacterized membrane protein YbaN (DUF454 family)
MIKKGKKIILMTLGYFLVILGVIGLIFPLMPGLIFLIPGIIILGEYVPQAKKIEVKIRQFFKLKLT